MNLRILILFSFVFLLYEKTSAQNVNDPWVEGVLSQILKKEIKVFDENFQILENEKIKLIKIDTVVNDQWTRPKFIDNIFQPSFDGVLMENEIVFDTSTNQNDPNFINFSISKYDLNGNYIEEEVAFLISRRNLLNHKLNSNDDQEVKKILFGIHLIFDNKKKVELDSCHLKYRLQLNGDFTFNQFYEPHNNSCSTIGMREDLEIGIEETNNQLSKYRNKIQGHYLSSSNGVWREQNQVLVLVSLDKKVSTTFSIERVNSQKMFLKLVGREYYVELIKLSK